MNVSNEPESWSDEEIPGLWSSWNDTDYSCIYRVPNHLRRVNPEAYTPQMLIIGPLHYSKKSAKTDPRYIYNTYHHHHLYRHLFVCMLLRV